MDVIPIIIAAISSAGLCSLIQFLINRRDNQKCQLTEIRQELAGISDTLDDTILRVTRNELRSLLFFEPKNHDAILQVAEHYFVELGGNSYIRSMFCKWANEQGIDISWLPKITKRKEK